MENVNLPTGMFSYTMLATSPLFCYPDWPRRFFGRFPAFLRSVLPLTSPDSQPSASCVYNEVQGTSDAHRATPPAAKASKLRFKHKLGAVFTILYIIEQFFMPYSHFITQVRLPTMCLFMLKGRFTQELNYMCFLQPAILIVWV